MISYLNSLGFVSSGRLIANSLFHERYNYRCRSHKQPWKRAEWDDPELPDGGLWLCCGAKSFNDPGCHLAIHEAG